MQKPGVKSAKPGGALQLHQFKKGMVGETGLIVPVPPSANYATYRLPFVLGEAAFAARDVVQRLKSRLRERGRRTAEAAE